MHQGVIGKRYQKLSTTRDSYLNRARTSASVTIPSLFPPEGTNGNTSLQAPAQSFGARAVNTLSSKISLTLLPPNQPFFRTTIDSSDLPEDISDETYGEIEQKLSETDNIVTTNLDTKRIRPVADECIKHLVVAGNGLLYDGPDSIKFYRLDKYVVTRDGRDFVREIIICEAISIDDVPKHIRHLVKEKTAELPSDNKDQIKLYTQIKRNGTHWVLTQEINGIPDPKARSTFPLSKMPYVPLRMIRMDGEDYGRGYVEEYIGDLKSLEVLTTALNEGTIAAARLLFLLNPNSITKLDDLNRAPNGGFVHGSLEDIGALQIDKQADFNQARQRMAEITEGLSAAFLMNSSLTRQAERVTATEIRAMAQELETVLGGVYALLATEFQLPLVEIELAQLQRTGRLPELPDGFMKPKILTGIAALGRTQELDKLRILLEYLQPFGPEVLSENMEIDEYIKRVVAALSIKVDDLIPSKETKRNRQNQKKMEEMMQLLGPQALQQAAPGGA